MTSSKSHLVLASNLSQEIFSTEVGKEVGYGRGVSVCPERLRRQVIATLGVSERAEETTGEHDATVMGRRKIFTVG